MSSQILLYSGPWAGPFCTQALKDQILNLSDDRSCRLKEVGSISDCWNDPSSVKAVFVPGGNMREISRHNEIPRNRSRIKEIFDKHCIAYYGACAGGLLACNDFQMQGK
jgi:hypothetical protein